MQAYGPFRLSLRVIFKLKAVLSLSSQCLHCIISENDELSVVEMLHKQMFKILVFFEAFVILKFFVCIRKKKADRKSLNDNNL